VPDEQARLLAASAASTSPALGAMLRVALGAGLRRRELLSLRRRDVVDLGGEFPRLLVREGAPGRATKGGAPREVPLFGVALAALRAWLFDVGEDATRDSDGAVARVVEDGHAMFTDAGERGASRDQQQLAAAFWATAVGVDPFVLADVEEQRAKSAVRADEIQHEPDPDAYVFPGQRGRAREDIPREGFERALRAARITRACRWHDLRHTCATSLLEGWWGRAWSIEEVQQLMGHSSRAMTERYIHGRGTLAARAAAEMRARRC